MPTVKLETLEKANLKTQDLALGMTLWRCCPQSSFTRWR